MWWLSPSAHALSPAVHSVSIAAWFFSFTQVLLHSLSCCSAVQRDTQLLFRDPLLCQPQSHLKSSFLRCFLWFCFHHLLSFSARLHPETSPSAQKPSCRQFICAFPLVKPGLFFSWVPDHWEERCRSYSSGFFAFSRCAALLLEAFLRASSPTPTQLSPVNLCD